MPKRLGWTILTISMIVLFILGTIVYLAFSAGPRAPSRLESSALKAEATVSWSEEGGTMVQAQSLSDALVLIGYGHARSRAWQLALWRQAALGRLSEWFGADALPADRMVRQLDIPGGARSAWDALDPNISADLAAFSEGIDLGVSAPDLSRGAPFLILDVQMEPWQPWHSLAVERLFAWMSSHPSGKLDAQNPDPWYEAVRTLEDLLSFHGTHVNFAAGVMQAERPYLTTRLATGSTGVPFFVESEIDYGSGRFTGLMVPGTLVSLLGRTHADAWALTGRTAMQIDSLVVSKTEVSTRFYRIRHHDQEEVVTAHYVGSRLLLDAPPREGASSMVRLLSWSGGSVGTDTGTWLAALGGSAPSPSLLSGDGVQWTGSSFRATGRPATVVQPENGILFVTSAPERTSPAATVAGLPEAPSLPEWMQTTLSMSAGRILEPIMTLLADSSTSPARAEEAIRYLRNWNLEYGAAEPGASILETLLTYPSLSLRDEAAVREALQETINLLSRRYGPEMSSWRWETVQERAVTFPGATRSGADGGRPEERFLDKYRSVRIRAPGHPQSLVWGSPPSRDSLRITSVWEGGLDLYGGTLHFRRPVVEFNRFLGTFLTGDRPPEVRTLRREPGDASTLFFPHD